MAQASGCRFMGSLKPETSGPTWGLGGVRFGRLGGCWGRVGGSSG